jgi:hypothetical protein
MDYAFDPLKLLQIHPLLSQKNGEYLSSSMHFQGQGKRFPALPDFFVVA